MKKLAEGATEVPIQPGLVERLAAGLRFIATGESSVWGSWFGSGVPLAPVAPPSDIRQYDFPVSTNINYTPRAGEPVTFATLRNLADGYDLLRLVIETRKDQLVKLEWSIRPKDKDKDPDDRCKEIEDFLRCPDGINLWEQWVRALWEEVFVTDALCLYPRYTKGKKPFALELIDGATIHPLIDETGRRPLDGPAFQQIVKGVVKANYTNDELYYRPQNVRVHKKFGYSRTEQVMTSVNTAIHRQLYQLQHYTQGTTPDLILSMPEGMSMNQIKEFSQWWESLLRGNSAQRRAGMIIPGGSKVIDTKEAILKDGFDEWLARIICYCFSVSPQGLIKEQNRSVANTQKDMAKEEGLVPPMKFLKSVMDRDVVERFFGYDDLNFTWVSEEDVSALVQSQIDTAYIAAGVFTVDEVRENKGLDPIKEEDKPEPQVLDPLTGLPKAPEGPVASPNSVPEPPKEPDATNPAEKLSKALKPIKRIRPLTRKVEAKMKKRIRTFLKAQAKEISAQVAKKTKKLAKMTRDEALAILESLDIDFSALGDDLEPLLAMIAQDGAAQALSQVGNTVSDLVSQANERAVTWAEDHAAELITNLEDSTRDKLRGELADLIESGASTSEISDALENSYAFSSDRADMIARTERAFADVQGNLAGYREFGVTQKRWILGSEHGPDDECNDAEAMGVVDIDDDFGGIGDPPAHPNCFLPSTVVSAAGVSTHYKRWFDGEIIRLVIEGHDDIAVTPNHLILTRRGWVKAAELHEGDDLIKSLDPVLTVMAINPNNHHIEARIEDISSALLMAGSMAPSSVPVAAEDFHGDGSGSQNVEVVTSAGGLRNAGYAHVAQNLNSKGLGSALSLNPSGSSQRDLASVGISLRAALDRAVSVAEPSQSGSVVNPASLDYMGFAGSADSQMFADESLADCRAMASETLGKIDARLTSLITSVKLQKVIKGEKFSGHVYNLQTESGWYFAGSIITHNCTCDIIAVLDDSEGEKSAQAAWRGVSELRVAKAAMAQVKELKKQLLTSEANLTQALTTPEPPIVNVQVAAPIINQAPIHVNVEAKKGGAKTITFKRDENGELLSSTVEED